MAVIKQLIDNDTGTQIYPITTTSAVLDNDSNTLLSLLDDKANADDMFIVENANTLTKSILIKPDEFTDLSLVILLTISVDQNDNIIVEDENGNALSTSTVLKLFNNNTNLVILKYETNNGFYSLIKYFENLRDNYYSWGFSGIGYEYSLTLDITYNTSTEELTLADSYEIFLPNSVPRLDTLPDVLIVNITINGNTITFDKNQTQIKNAYNRGAKIFGISNYFNRIYTCIYNYYTFDFLSILESLHLLDEILLYNLDYLGHQIGDIVRNLYTIIRNPSDNTPSTSGSLAGSTYLTSGSAGSSNDYSRADHRHPSDPSRVPVTREINGHALNADITLTASDVGALSSSTDIPQAATATPLVDGTAAVGSSTKYAKEDHVHPTDTSRVPTTRTINGQALSSDITLTANDVGAATSSDISTAISNLVNSAPTTLDTLNELATALGNDPNFATTITNKIAAQQVHVGSVAGKLYRNDVNGGGNFTVRGNSGCIPNLTAGTFLVSIYAKSATQSYTFRFNFGSSVTYDLSTTNGEISDVRQITIPSNGTFSGSVLNGSVASGTILYVVMYNYLTPVSTVGVAAVTNQYNDLDNIPNGTLTIQKNGTTVGTFTANQSSNTTANITVPTTASDVGAVPTTRKINDKELSTDITLTASDVGALPNNTVIPSVINNLTTTTTGSALDASQGKALKDLVDGKTSKFIVDFTLSGTTISNPTKTFAEIQTAYDAGNIVLARDDANSLYYLLYCVDTDCGFFCSDSGTLYTIDVNSSNTWTYQETNISQLELDLSDKSQIIYMQKVNNVWKKLNYNSSTGAWLVDNTTLTTGNTKNIYLDKDNNDLYYWNGSVFTLLSEDKVLSDWNLTDTTKVDYIKNKPSIPTTASDINAMSTSHAANSITSNDINSWNAKADVVTLVTVSGTGAVTLALDANKFYKFGTLTSLTLTLNSVSNGLGIYAGKFTASSNGCTLSVPATVTESIDNPSITANGTYEFNIMDNVLLMVQI